MPAADVASQARLPSGFRMTVFAAEPDVAQPIAIATDARGRLWVASNQTYSEASIGFDPKRRDSILVFDDTDNDGTFDKRTVFWDDAQRLTSVEVGLGGVWALCPPQLLFIPDRNGDDVPDGPAEVVLDGFDFEKARHTVANGLRFGPDGWLYGRQGMLAASRPGVPGTPADKREPLAAGIWRFHPTRHVFEVVARGTTNPWGMDWDAHGEAFFVNTVIGHLWHLLPGAYYGRAGDWLPRLFEPIEQHADHLHWAAGEVWSDAGRGPSDATSAAGGGHVHTGALIYQGGAWPPDWNGRLLTLNFHGRRVNVERLERLGAGVVGRAAPDAFFFTDPWFRGTDILAAPDGGVFIADWSDDGECHDDDGVQRRSGRIFKVVHGQERRPPVGDLGRLGERELVALQTNANDWFARQARRVLAARFAAGEALHEARAAAEALARGGDGDVVRLRALWTLHVAGGAGEAVLRAALRRGEYERTWALRLWHDEASADPTLAAAFARFGRSELPRLAARERAASVRLAMAGMLSRLPVADRHALAAVLLAHGEDADDHDLPLLVWYGIEPLALLDERFVDLVIKARMPRVQRLAARRLAEEIDAHPPLVNELVGAAAHLPGGAAPVAILEGLSTGLAGRRQLARPATWPAVSARFGRAAIPRLRQLVSALEARWGDPRALDAARSLMRDAAAEVPARAAALQQLIDARVADVRTLCEEALKVRGLVAVAAAGLALLDDPTVADALVAAYPHVDPSERLAVMSALVSRPRFAARLLDAVAGGRLRRADVGVAQARQIRAFGDRELLARLGGVWGEIHDADEAAAAATIARFRARLGPEALAAADPVAGRQLFRALCGACHTLYGEGGTLGRDLTGAGRADLGYLLENILFPSAVVPEEYRPVTVRLKDGRVLFGLVRGHSAQTLTVVSAGQSLVIEAGDVLGVTQDTKSIMPEGLLDGLDDASLRNLIRFLMSKAPPPALPAP